EPSSATINAALARSRTVFYTPPVLGTLRDLRATLSDHIMRVEVCIDEHLQRDVQGCRVVPCQDLVELLIFDEAERLSMAALECTGDLFDRTGVGVILIGMPGMEKRLSRYPQLYSRVGFAHHYRPLQGDELAFVLTRHWRKLGPTGSVTHPASMRSPPTRPARARLLCPPWLTPWPGRPRPGRRIRRRRGGYRLPAARARGHLGHAPGGLDTCSRRHRWQRFERHMIPSARDA